MGAADDADHPDAVLATLRESSRPLEVHEIWLLSRGRDPVRDKMDGGGAKKSLNAVLYRLESQGRVRRVGDEGGRPRWAHADSARALENGAADGKKGCTTTRALENGAADGNARNFAPSARALENEAADGNAGNLRAIENEAADGDTRNSARSCGKALRAYQRRIVDNVSDQNSIVVLPTGAGKTLIAGEVMKRKLRERWQNNAAIECSPGTASSLKVLFLVPTCLLVEQQAEALREWLGPNTKVGEYMGGLTMPSSFHVLVSTPKAFMVAQQKNGTLLGWRSFGLVVFDEVHHVLRDHPYRKLALSIRAENGGSETENVGLGRAPAVPAPSPSPQILGLSASLTYAVTEKKVSDALARLASELRIAHMETATTEELQLDGYHASANTAEIVVEGAIPDVTIEGVVPTEDRKPHLMLRTFWQRAKTGKLTRMAADLLDLVSLAERVAKSRDGKFESPLSLSKTASWGRYAHKMAEKDACHAELEHLYEALKMLVISWEEDQELCAMYLQMSLLETKTSVSSAELQGALARFIDAHGQSRPRFDLLKESLLHQEERVAGTAAGQTSAKSLRAIVFVQQRVTAYILAHYINQDPELRAAGLANAVYLFATSSPATASIGLTRGEADTRLQRFREGSSRVLVSTVVCEEGMDVPEANCVVRFDPMLTSVSYVQGRGRAREAGSSLLVLREREDRPTALLADVERQQQAIIASFDAKKTAAGASDAERAAEVAAQTSRERGAKAGLIDTCGAGGGALAALQLFAKKTKVALQEEFDVAVGQCKLRYVSCLREAEGCSPSGFGSTKVGRKDAKREAASELRDALRRQLAPS